MEDPPDGGTGAPAARFVELGPDELRCVFAALLTLPEPTRDLGRCVRRLLERLARAREPRRCSRRNEKFSP
jgi:hypothetical protein